jgi:nucleotide-binding universal stress UspA family protein
LFEFVRAKVPASVPLDAEVVDALSVHDEIVTQATRLRADLIVMGTHGRGSVKRLLLGSVAERVLRLAGSPVLTVGAASQTVPGAHPFKRILCGIDFSECSLAALAYAMTLAERAEAAITVVNVIEWAPIGYDPLVGPPTDLAGYRLIAEADNRKRLRQAVEKTNPKQLSVEEVVTFGKPRHEILRIATEQDRDLIVLGIHGRNPIDRMFLGSTAEPVLRHARCPVLTVRTDSAL